MGGVVNGPPGQVVGFFVLEVGLVALVKYTVGVDAAGPDREDLSLISLKPNKVSWPVPYNAGSMP